MLVQAIQASLIDAGKGHDVQPASAGTGSTSKVQVDAGPDLKVQNTFLVCRLALPSCYMRCLSQCLCACSMTSSEAACSTCACVALTLVT